MTPTRMILAALALGLYVGSFLYAREGSGSYIGFMKTLNYSYLHDSETCHDFMKAVHAPLIFIEKRFFTGPYDVYIY